MYGRLHHFLALPFSVQWLLFVDSPFGFSFLTMDEGKTSITQILSQ